MSPVEEEARTRPTNPAMDAAQWFGVPRPDEAEPMHEGGFDAEYGPPGLPMFLAEAQGVKPTPTDDVDTFDATDDLLLISNKMMQMPAFGGLLMTDESPGPSFQEAESVVIVRPPVQDPTRNWKETRREQ